MANPTFDSTALTTKAATERIGGRRSRVYIDNMPGVNGAFVQAHGYGARQIVAAGLLKTGSTYATPTLAITNIWSEFVTVQNKSDGVTVATYVSTTGVSYTNCVLVAYEAAGRPQAVRDGANWSGILPVRATVLHLATAT